MKDHIKDYWENQGKTFKNSYKASWSDQYAIALEIQEICNHINKNDDILDAGCANGYSSFQYNDSNPNSVTGVDFAKNMIHHAKEQSRKLNLENKFSFYEGDVRKLSFSSSTFDMSISTRVLINLRNWEEQKSAIRELIRVTKNGGKILLSEAFYEPLVLLNSMRRLVSLDPLYEHDFNKYIKKKKLEKFLEQNQYPFECKEISSVYYLGSRFLRELITDYNSYEGYSNPINKQFFELEEKYNGGGFGIQQIYIINKNE